jgi:hypothetical protein
MFFNALVFFIVQKFLLSEMSITSWFSTTGYLDVAHGLELLSEHKSLEIRTALVTRQIYWTEPVHLSPLQRASLGPRTYSRYYIFLTDLTE